MATAARPNAERRPTRLWARRMEWTILVSVTKQQHRPGR
jgi:hypothetical protein